MQLADLDLNLVPVLEALLEERNVSKTAVRLGMTQSSVSHALRRLRTYFNDPLFVRSGAGMTPTPKSLALAPVLAEVMDRVRSHLVSGAGFDPQCSERTFSLGMTDMAELSFLPSLIQHVQHVAPRVRLRAVKVSPRDAPKCLEERQIDLNLGSARMLHPALYQQELMRHPLVCIVNQRDPRFTAGVTLEGYRTANHVGVSPFGADEDVYDWAFTDQGIQRRFTVMTQGFLVVPLLVAGAPLVATVPKMLGEAFSAFANVRVWQLPFPVAPIELRQSWHPRFHHDPANRWLRRAVRDLFALHEGRLNIGR